jgi:serine/threonine protein phosphatase PrpC
MDEDIYLSLLSTYKVNRRADPNAFFPVDGSTAAICLLVDSTAYFANCGDTAAALITEDELPAFISDSHTTLVDSEVIRVEAAGGQV